MTDQARWEQERLQKMAETVLDLEAALVQAEEQLAAADEMFWWIRANYPKVLRELPTPIYERVRAASKLLAVSPEENQAAECHHREMGRLHGSPEENSCLTS